VARGRRLLGRASLNLAFGKGYRPWRSMGGYPCSAPSSTFAGFGDAECESVCTTTTMSNIYQTHSMRAILRVPARPFYFLLQIWQVPDYCCASLIRTSGDEIHSSYVSRRCKLSKLDTQLCKQRKRHHVRIISTRQRAAAGRLLFSSLVVHTQQLQA
jgi:hypothetical protein